ncbi:tyrosine-type recombinase/integrase [Trueperella sp. LYQ141]|uniref:tyrosine-type recombinase/integrase n=1 Tax=Trueperella sp. LYQ141 TaxID=3391058 RepID=UPI00398314E2
MRSTFGNVVQKPDRRPHGRYKHKGKTYYTPTRDRVSQVRHDLARIHATILDGTWEDPKRLERKQITLHDWTNKWLEQINNSDYSPGTYRSYRSYVRAHILPFFGPDTPLHAIDTTAVNEFADHLRATSTKAVFSASLRTLSSLLRAAQRTDHIETLPTMPDGIYKKMKRPPEKQVTYTHTDLLALVEVAEPRFRAAIALAGWGCMRSGEVGALQRKHVSEDGKWIKIERTTKRDVSGRTVVGPPKSEAGRRMVSLPKVAARIVKDHLDLFCAPGDEALLFAPHNYDREEFVSDRVLRYALHRACERAGLPKARFHDLRHSGLTLFGQAGATLADLMARAGHSTVDTVLIYQHSARARDAELSARMGK